MNPETVKWMKFATILAFWLGMVARVLLPYLKAYWEQEGQLPFDWKFVKGQLVGSLTAFLAMLATGGNTLLSEIGAMGLGIAFLAGYFSAHGGREAQKFANAGQTYLLTRGKERGR
jgi:hypothetical protein